MTVSRQARALLLGATIAVLTLGAGCSGDGEDPEPFIEPDDAAANAVLPIESDLPAGWNEIGRNEPEGGTIDLSEYLKAEPTCADVAALVESGGLFGHEPESPEEAPPGTASAEFERPSSEDLVDANLEARIDVKELAGDIEGSWGLIQAIFEAEETKTCFEAAFTNGLAAWLDEEDLPGAIEMTVAATEPAVEAPQEGIGLGFDVDLTVAARQFDLTVQLYLWPYANGGVTVTLFTERDSIAMAELGGILDAIDRKIVQAAAAGVRPD
jgi:hypothetical protein